MKQEVIDFYNNNKIPVSKMVQVGVRRKGLSSESIKEAAESVYNDIKDGVLNVKPIQIAWIVYGRSCSDSSPASTAAVYDAVVKLEKKMDDYMTPWYTKLGRRFK